jgi:MFS transporter, OFA family, oxalate/formate antiporter
VSRWFRLTAAVAAMMMISNLQYAWTLFVKPLVGATHWKLSDVQYAFTLFVIFQTWVMPCSGWLIDRLGPRVFMTIAGLMCGAGWAAIGHAASIPELYAFYSIAGFGAALVYCGAMGIALKWFPDKRGLAAGLIAAGYGSGAALFTWMIGDMIKHGGYRNAFLYTGIIEGLVIVLAAQFLINPAKPAAPAPAQIRAHQENFNSFEMLRTPHFYMLFSMALMMGIGGLMVTAQVAPIADTFKIGSAALATAVFLNPLANGAGRLFWGWVSDHIGRERTMVVAFLLQSACLLGVVTVGKTSPAMFIASCALVFFTWGEVYSLFPSATADFFGARHASSNYSFVYSAKGVASIMGGGLAAVLFEKTGSWNYGFYACAVLALISALLAFILRTMALPSRSRQAATTAPVGG